MAKYAEGNPVILPVTNTAVSSTTMIAADTQLAAMLGPRYWSTPLFAMHAKISDEGTVWVSTSAGVYIETNKNSAECHVPVSIPAGCKITNVRSVISGAAGTNNDGGIYFGAEGEGDVVSYFANKTGWPSAGATYGNAVATVTDATGAGDYTVLDDSVLWWRVVFPTNSAAQDCRVHGLFTELQFGN